VPIWRRWYAPEIDIDLDRSGRRKGLKESKETSIVGVLTDPILIVVLPVLCHSLLCWSTAYE